MLQILFIIISGCITEISSQTAFNTNVIIGNSVNSKAEVYTLRFNCTPNCISSLVQATDRIWQSPTISGVSEIKRVKYLGLDAVLTTTQNGAIVYQYPAAGTPLFHREIQGYTTNVHSAEILPDGYVVIADSYGWLGILKTGSTVNQKSSQTNWYPLQYAHGVVWDKTNQCLWALGYLVLNKYTYSTVTHALTLVSSYSFDSLYDEPNHNETGTYEDGGHDLYPIDGAPGQLFMSTGEHVFRFNTTDNTFSADTNLFTVPSVNGQLPGLAVPNKGGVKGITTDSANGIIFIRPSPWFKEIYNGNYPGVSNYPDKGRVIVWSMPGVSQCLNPDLDLTTNCKVSFATPSSVLFYKARSFITPTFSF